VKALLDTYTLLWATLSPKSLSVAGTSVIANETIVILISAASAWEISSKVRLGKLNGADVLEREFLEVIQLAGYTLLPISVADGLRAGRLTSEHRDPFDRMIAAQALAGDLPVISPDAQLDSLGVRRIW
jgi:PIN domain nuclease of toxin-antitoxin system